MSRFYLSFDDTDNLNTLGTGHLLQDFLDALPWQTSFISRHQLFVHPNVPFTSHNSAMCAIVEGEVTGEELIALGSRYLETHLADGADPGLCVADEAVMIHPEELTLWGYRAKKEVLTKADAYALAAECRVHLSEHGGTGQGVVGALAAIGLRLAGQDGRVKGKKQVDRDCLTVDELLAQTGFQRVCAYGQGQLPGSALVRVDGQPIKAVYQNYCSTVLTVPDGDAYRLLRKDQLKCF